MRDQHNSLKLTVALNAATISSNTTTNGVIIDTYGFDGLEFALQSGNLTDGAYAASFTHGDQANLSDGAAVAAGDLLGAAPTFAATDDNVVKKVGYRGNKRYVRLTITSTGVTTGGIMAAQAVLGHSRYKPVS